MSLWSRIFSKRKQAADAPTASRGKYVNKNPWGIHEGMLVKQVHCILKQNGFKEETVDLPAKFGPDPPGYKYPCWSNIQTSTNIVSTFKFNRLLEFSVSKR